ncbi:MAG: hypothetical protein ABR955_07800 [Verrucomicrobiota bacterium]|jgi:hypothetical protein
MTDFAGSFKFKNNQLAQIMTKTISSHLLFTMIGTVALLGAFNATAQTPPFSDSATYVNNFAVGANSSPFAGSGSVGSWIYWYNTPGGGIPVTNDVNTPDPLGGAGAGSMEIFNPFTAAGTQNLFFGTFDNGYGYDGTVTANLINYSTLSFDVYVGTNQIAPNSSGNYGTLSVGGVYYNGSGGWAYEGFGAGTVTIPASASNTWTHFSVPVDHTIANVGDIAGIGFDYPNYSGYPTNTFTFWIGNLVMTYNGTPPPPPTNSIMYKPPQGLNFVEGSISSQFDRQNIATISGNNYQWADTASVGNPVTYSFDISQYNAPDLNYHVFFYQTSGAGSASAPDYNQPNVMILEISPLTNTSPVSGIASITWKTNLPNSGTISNAVTITNATLVGNWQLQFTSATAGTIIAPGAVSYPFTLDPSVSSKLADPITVNFGINPSIDSNYVVGESVVISQIAITGSGALSSEYPTTDNFLDDSGLDTTNTWAVNALTPGSIWFVPTNTPYSVNWTVPAVGYDLQVGTNLANSASYSTLSLPSDLLTPGERTLIPQASLPAGKQGFFRLTQFTPTQLQVLWPGETNAPNTVSGKVGTPTEQSLSGTGGLVNATVNECDDHWNIVNTSGDDIQITGSSENIIDPNNAPIENGTLQQTIDFEATGSYTITATDLTNTNITSNTSSTITIGN